ncbi:CcdB family protein [soil metagenome]
MAQFDVYRNPDSHSSLVVPYLLDIQSDLLSLYTTRVVVPLILAAKAEKPIKHFNPQFTIERNIVMLVMAEITNVPRNWLKTKITSLQEHRYEILQAIDILISGV